MGKKDIVKWEVRLNKMKKNNMGIDQPLILDNYPYSDDDEINDLSFESYEEPPLLLYQPEENLMKGLFQLGMKNSIKEDELESIEDSDYKFREPEINKIPQPDNKETSTKNINESLGDQIKKKLETSKQSKETPFGFLDQIRKAAASALHTNTNGSQATSKSGSPKKKNEIPELVMPVSKIKKDIFK